MPRSRGDVVGQRGSAARNREGGGLVADVLEGERRPCGDADRVASVRKGAHPAGGPGNHVDPDEGLLVIRRGDDASDGHISPCATAIAGRAHRKNARMLSRSFVFA